MRFVGQTEIAAFLLERPLHGDALRAWVAEVKHQRWMSADEMAADFRNVDASDLPIVMFYVASTGLRIETLVNFRIGIVLVTGITAFATLPDRNVQPLKVSREH
jgi:mRNA-degrading endonuclease HigB of HigAB toxin-antitoxin module